MRMSRLPNARVPPPLTPRPMSRSFLSRLLALLVLLAAASAAPALAQTGPAVPEMANYDAFAESLVSQYRLPGLSIAVMKDGRLVYARGFGIADPTTGEPVQPTSRFRIASLSKAITSAVAMRLVDRGLLSLDAPAFALLPDLPPLPGQTEDPRLATITVRDLLQHSGGWDRDATGYDPMFDPARIATAAGVPPPADCPTIIRFMRGRPLDFAPGTRYAYSNFGYCVLGRILERVSSQSYEALTLSFLAEAGIGTMQLGATRPEGRLPGRSATSRRTGRRFGASTRLMQPSRGRMASSILRQWTLTAVGSRPASTCCVSFAASTVGRRARTSSRRRLCRR